MSGESFCASGMDLLQEFFEVAGGAFCIDFG
jgi:hypothetical protein